jgi:hypothetical protein
MELLKVWLAVFIVVEFFCVQPLAQACTAFCVVRNGQVLFCNNEDFTKPGYIWFVAAEKGRYGRVNFGFADRFVQGSMNDQGLAFDAMALSEVPWQADSNKETPQNLIEKIMNECGSVAEAIGYFEKFNCQHLKDGQFLFADATGEAAVIAWLPESGLSIQRLVSDHLIATNTRLGMSGYRCKRYVRTEQILSSTSKSETDDLSQVLEAVHQRGPGGFTSYSNIFDLKARKIYLYNLANYREQIELDLSTELQNGSKQPQPMIELFRASPSLDEIRAGDQRNSWNTQVQLSDSQLDKLIGTYSPETDPSIKIRVTRKEGQLQVENPGQPVATLFPESSTSFRIAPDRGQVTFVFDESNASRSSGFVLHKTRDLKAIRVGD